MAWKFGISTIDYPYIDQNPKMKILKIFFSKFLHNLKSPRVAYSYHTIPTSAFSQSEKMKYPHTFLHTLCGRSFSEQGEKRQEEMLSRTTSLCLGAAGLAFLGYCVYFDRKRRSDPMYKEKIRQSKWVKCDDLYFNELVIPLLIEDPAASLSYSQQVISELLMKLAWQSKVVCLKFDSVPNLYEVSHYSQSGVPMKLLLDFHQLGLSINNPLVSIQCHSLQTN